MNPFFGVCLSINIKIGPSEVGNVKPVFGVLWKARPSGDEIVRCLIGCRSDILASCGHRELGIRASGASDPCVNDLEKCPNRQTELQLGYLVVLEYLFASQRPQREKAIYAEPVSRRVLVYQLGNVKVPVFGVLWM